MSQSACETCCLKAWDFGAGTWRRLLANGRDSCTGWKCWSTESRCAALPPLLASSTSHVTRSARTVQEIGSSGLPCRASRRVLPQVCIPGVLLCWLCSLEALRSGPQWEGCRFGRFSSDLSEADPMQICLTHCTFRKCQHSAQHEQEMHMPSRYSMVSL